MRLQGASRSSVTRRSSGMSFAVGILYVPARHRRLIIMLTVLHTQDKNSRQRWRSALAGRVLHHCHPQVPEGCRLLLGSCMCPHASADSSAESQHWAQGCFQLDDDMCPLLNLLNTSQSLVGSQQPLQRTAHPPAQAGLADSAPRVLQSAAECAAQTDLQPQKHSSVWHSKLHVQKGEERTWAASVQDARRQPLVILIAPHQLLQACPAHALHKTSLHLQQAKRVTLQAWPPTMRIAVPTTVVLLHTTGIALLAIESSCSTARLHSGSLGECTKE